jgi:hypothetical protein
LLLLRPDATGGTFYLNAGEDRHLLPDHLGCDGARGPADQVAAAFGQPEAHGSAVLIPQRAAVIAMQPHRAAAACEPDLLLDGLFAGHLRSLVLSVDHASARPRIRALSCRP